MAREGRSAKKISPVLALLPSRATRARLAFASVRLKYAKNHACSADYTLLGITRTVETDVEKISGKRNEKKLSGPGNRSNDGQPTGSRAALHGPHY